MKLRVKAWYAKELELDGEIARSTMHVHAPDGHGGFYMHSANSRRSGHPLENVLNGHQDRIVAVVELCSGTDRLGFQGQKQLPPFSDPLKSEGRQGLYSLSVDGRSERKEGILEDSMG